MQADSKENAVNTLKRPIAVLAVLSGIGMVGTAFPGLGSERPAHTTLAVATVGSTAAANALGTAASPSNEDWG
jgi:hypothetical protein